MTKDMEMYQEYAKQTIEIIKKQFKCSDEQALDVFNELSEEHFEKWKEKNETEENKTDTADIDEILNDFLKDVPCAVKPYILIKAAGIAVGLIKGKIKQESEEK